MKKAISYLLPFLVVLALWQLVTQLGLWSSYILPLRSGYAPRPRNCSNPGQLAKHTAISLAPNSFGLCLRLWACPAC